jgi:hypothetical protein
VAHARRSGSPAATVGRATDATSPRSGRWGPRSSGPTRQAKSGHEPRHDESAQWTRHSAAYRHAKRARVPRPTLCRRDSPSAACRGVYLAHCPSALSPPDPDIRIPPPSLESLASKDSAKSSMNASGNAAQAHRFRYSTARPKCAASPRKQPQ